MYKKKLQIRKDTLRTLTERDMRDVAGGGPNTNLTCQAGCQTIYCPTNHVSCPANCTLKG